MTTVHILYQKAFDAGRQVQIIEQSGEEVDGRAIWNELEITTNKLKDIVLTHYDQILQYNPTLKPIYSEMNNIILEFGMDKSEFNPKSNHFFCQLMNLVDIKSKFKIKLNKIMQLGFNAGQLSVFLEKNTLPVIITDFIERNNMLELDTYVNTKTQDIINNTYLVGFKGGKNTFKLWRSRQNKRRIKKSLVKK